MQNLLAFIARHFHWLLFVVLETVSAVLLFRYNHYQNSVWVTSANAVAGQVYEWQAGVEQFFAMKRMNEQLTCRNVFLEQEVARLRQRIADMADSTAAAAILADSMPRLTTIAAKVVANSVDRADNLMTIDRGLADGVRPDMGVVCGTGLVGVVYKATQHYAVVIPVLNRHSRISCSIRNRGYFGYLSWQGGNPLEARVEDIPRHAQFDKGEWIETSGFSAIFPPGVLVGQIVGIDDSADGLSYSLTVRLATDFACLRDVSVVTNSDMLERMRLSEAAADSLSVSQ